MTDQSFQEKLDEYHNTLPDYSATTSDDVKKQTEKAFVKKSNKITNVDSLVNDKNFMRDLRIYAENRYGTEGGQIPDENDRQYVGRFLASMSQMDSNSVYGLSTLDYVRNSNKEERERFGRLLNVWDNVDYNWWGKKEEGSLGFFQRGGGAEYLFGMISDPINLLTVGAGKLVAQTLGKQTKKSKLKQLIGSRMAATATGGVLGGSESAAFDYAAQKTRVDAGLEKRINWTQVGLSAGIGAGIGSSLSYVGKTNLSPFEKGKFLTETEEITKKDLVKKLPRAKKQAQQQSELEDFNPVHGDTNVKRDTDLLDDADTSLKTQYELDLGDNYESIINTKLSKKMVDVVNDIIVMQEELVDAGLAPDTLLQKDADDKVSDFVAKFLKSMQDEGQTRVGRLVSKLKGREGGSELRVSEVVDEDVLERALAENDLSIEQFFDYLVKIDSISDDMKASVSKGAKLMQPYSNLSRSLNMLGKLDPEFVAKARQLYGIKEESVEGLSYFDRWFSGLKGADRNRRALMVSKVSTTIRNIFTGGAVVGFQTASDTMEASLYYGGKAIRAAAEGRADFSSFKAGLVDMARDSFGTIAYLTEQGFSKQAADILLANNRNLHKKMFRTLQESGDADQLWWFTKYSNTLNMMQDSFFRRAFFMASVDKAMRRTAKVAGKEGPMQTTDKIRPGFYGNVGDDAINIKTNVDVDLDDAQGKFDFLQPGFFRGVSKENKLFRSLYEGKNVPIEILVKGVDDALKATFAYSPSTRKGDPALLVNMIRMIENTPFVGTAMFPFARFMANALAFQYKYSLFNPAIAVPKTLLNKGFKNLNERDFAVMRDSIAKGAVGTAATFVAALYRIENQDTKWFDYKTKEGVMDMRPFFPAAPYLFVGDIMAKLHLGKDTSEMFELRTMIDALSGISFRTGVANVVISGLFDKLSEEVGDYTQSEAKGAKYLNLKQREKLAEITGKWLGELTGGYTNNLVLGGLNEIIDALSAESAIVRDSKVVEGWGAWERGKNSFFNSAKKNIPNLDRLGLPFNKKFSKETLPEFRSPTRSGTITKRVPMLSFFGFKIREYRTPIEEELLERGFESWEVMIPTGDRQVDALIKTELGKIIERDFPALTVDSPIYQQKTDTEKETFLLGQLEIARKQAKEAAELNFRENKNKVSEYSYDAMPFTPFEKLKWDKTPKRARILAEEALLELQRRDHIEIYGNDMYFVYRPVNRLGNYGYAADLAKTLYNKGKKR